MSSENYENILGRCIDSLKSCKELSFKYLKSDEKILGTIQELTKEYSEANFEVEKADRALSKLRAHLESSTGDDPNIDDLYNQFLKENETELDYTDSDIWKEVFSGEDITEVKPKSKKLSISEYDKVDDSLLCSNVFKPPVDPISKTIIKDPYKNRICGHSFEYEFILSYIKEKKNKAKCPYVGCTNHTFRASDLRPDDNLKTKVIEYFESHQNEESSEED
ncbi:hypothetical protein HHI36_014572 [Cryptolaemus montrouzieri]|uniref:E3 SUMO-protein ligase NSE2 n=1 Tax=Cryptolaemus montrouzieri TaxID=559131 RepID=A0ABD2N333_9CUCU